MASYVVLVPCAGNGKRFGGDIPKQYVKIGDKSILEHTLTTFLSIDIIKLVVVVVDSNDNQIDSIFKNPRIKILKVGGQTRAETVLNGLNVLNLNKDDWVLVHDAVRCCITKELVEKQIIELKNDMVGGILAISANDTIKLVVANKIIKTLDRNQIYLAQTPQMFRFGILKEALSVSDLTEITDEASSVENLGLEVKVIQGSAANIKVTYQSDITLAEILLNN